MVSLVIPFACEIYIEAVWSKNSGFVHVGSFVIPDAAFDVDFADVYSTDT